MTGFFFSKKLPLSNVDENATNLEITGNLIKKLEVVMENYCVPLLAKEKGTTKVHLDYCGKFVVN